MTNYHTHTIWCDGADSPEKVVLSAIEKGFSEIGFSSHAMLPGSLLDWALDAGRAVAYAAERHAGRIRVLCGVEADYVPGISDPDRLTYAFIAPDYIIGSVHFVTAPDGGHVCVDESPKSLADGIRDHFGGDIEAYIRAYFRQQCEMAEKFDFDVVGHLDLVRKFNAKHPYFDENAAWYRETLEGVADSIAATGKIVEVNTGAIARGWMDDAYPSADFRGMLRERGVRFVLSADAHSAAAIDCAFDRFSSAERYVTL